MLSVVSSRIRSNCRWGALEVNVEVAVPACPACGSTMVMRRAQRGAFAGKSFWGCSTYATTGCTGRLQIDGTQSAAAPLAGASAQAEFERRESARRSRVRRMWPLWVGVGLILINGVFLMVSGMGLGFGWGPRSFQWAGAAAAVTALVFMVGLISRPALIDAYRKGAEGERLAGRRLDGLAEAGFVVLHDRRAPGYGGNLDHVVIGPTGVWAVETKALRGKVEIDGDELRVGKRSQDRIVDQ